MRADPADLGRHLIGFQFNIPALLDPCRLRMILNSGFDELSPASTQPEGLVQASKAKAAGKEVYAIPRFRRLMKRVRKSALAFLISIGYIICEGFQRIKAGTEVYSNGLLLIGLISTNTIHPHRFYKVMRCPRMPALL